METYTLQEVQEMLLHYAGFIATKGNPFPYNKESTLWWIQEHYEPFKKGKLPNPYGVEEEPSQIKLDGLTFFTKELKEAQWVDSPDSRYLQTILKDSWGKQFYVYKGKLKGNYCIGEAV